MFLIKKKKSAGEDISSLLTFMFVIMPNISFIRKKNRGSQDS